jgi:hypothetical protein
MGSVYEYEYQYEHVQIRKKVFTFLISCAMYVIGETRLIVDMTTRTHHLATATTDHIVEHDQYHPRIATHKKLTAQAPMHARHRPHRCRVPTDSPVRSRPRAQDSRSCYFGVPRTRPVIFRVEMWRSDCREATLARCFACGATWTRQRQSTYTGYATPSRYSSGPNVLSWKIILG